MSSILDVYGNFNNLLLNVKNSIDIKIDYSLSKNYVRLKEIISIFYNKILLCFYVKNSTEFYINKTIDNLNDFINIQNEKDFLKFLCKLDSY